MYAREFICSCRFTFPLDHLSEVEKRRKIYCIDKSLSSISNYSGLVHRENGKQQLDIVAGAEHNSIVLRNWRMPNQMCQLHIKIYHLCKFKVCIQSIVIVLLISPIILQHLVVYNTKLHVMRIFCLKFFIEERKQIE